jgi:hypothetical protein
MKSLFTVLPSLGFALAFALPLTLSLSPLALAGGLFPLTTLLISALVDEARGRRRSDGGGWSKMSDEPLARQGEHRPNWTAAFACVLIKHCSLEPNHSSPVQSPQPNFHLDQDT